MNYEELNAKLASEIKDLRVEKGISLEDVSLRTGIDVRALIAFEDCRYIFSAAKIDAVMQAIGAEFALTPKENKTEQ